jgi:hypothetical protein
MRGLGPIGGRRTAKRLTPLLVSLLLVWLLALTMAGAQKSPLHDEAPWPVLNDPAGQGKLLPSRSSVVCGVRSDEGSSDPPQHCLTPEQYEPAPSQFQTLSVLPPREAPQGVQIGRRTSARPREPPTYPDAIH